jgi:NADH dehydrogenase
VAWKFLILGGGFGGFTAARRLERILPAQAARVTLVNDVNFMLYTPLLPGAAGATLQSRQLVVPLREELPATDVRVAKVLGADPERRCVRVQPLEGEECELDYDQLIVAFGSSSRMFPIAGLKEHAIGFKTLAEGVALRNRLIQNLERAKTAEDPGRGTRCSPTSWSAPATPASKGSRSCRTTPARS